MMTLKDVLIPCLIGFAAWTDVGQGTAILRNGLTYFNAMLTALAAVAANNFIMMNTQGVLAPGDWANELHPVPRGFKTIAGAFLNAFRAYLTFAGRI